MKKIFWLFCLLPSFLWAQQKEILSLPFNNNAKDESPLRLKTQERGNVEYREDRFGTPCSALYLDGNSFVEVMHNRVFNTIENQFSVATWFKLDKAPQEDAWLTLVCKAKDDLTETSINPHFRVQLFQSTTQSTISINTDFTEYDKNFKDHVLEADKWMFFALVYDGNAVNVHLNGKKIWTFPYRGRLNSNNTSLFIGKDYPGSIEYFRGSFDDLHIYNYAISNQKIHELFHADPNYSLANFNRTNPDDVIVGTDQGTCGKQVDYYTPQYNVCEKEYIEWISGKQSGSFFQLGTTNNVFKIMQGENVIICRNKVVVEDQEKPQVNCPNDTNITIQSGTWVQKKWNISYSDNCPNTRLERVDAFKNQSELKPGVYEIKHQVTDPSGNQTECSFKVTIKTKEEKPTQKPIELICPSDKRVLTTNEWTYQDKWKPTYDPSIQVQSLERVDIHRFKKKLPPGKYEIKYKLTDQNGSVAFCSFILNVVKKKEKLNLNCPKDQTVFTTGTKWKFEENWELDYGQNIQVQSIERVDVHRFKKELPVGTYEIKYKLTDVKGNTAICSFNVTVKKKQSSVSVPNIPCPKDTSIYVVGGNWTIQDLWIDRLRQNTNVTNVQRTDSYTSQRELGTGTYKFKYQITNVNGVSTTCSLNITIKKETIKIKKEYEFDKEEVIMVIYDNKTQDGDRISVYFNGKKVEDNYTVQNKDVGVLKKKLKLTPGKQNIIVIQALNMGDVGKNTVQIDFYDKEKKRLLESKPKFSKVYDSTPGFSSGVSLKYKK